MWATSALAADSFIISDIRVEGLQRISEGTVYSYLPLNRGDLLTSSNARSAMRELYRTGFFQDIELSREGDILVITVLERPAIAAVSLSGNKAIKDDDLYRVLHDIGLSEGEVFDRLELDRLQQELVKQYYSQGRYAVKVDTRVTELERNRVRIARAMSPRSGISISSVMKHLLTMKSARNSKPTCSRCGSSGQKRGSIRGKSSPATLKSSGPTISIAVMWISTWNPPKSRSARTSRTSTSPPTWSKATYTEWTTFS